MSACKYKNRFSAFVYRLRLADMYFCKCQFQASWMNMNYDNHNLLQDINFGMSLELAFVDLNTPIKSLQSKWMWAYGIVERLRKMLTPKTWRRRWVVKSVFGCWKKKITRHKNTPTDENGMENFRFVDENSFVLVFSCSAVNISWLCLCVIGLNSVNRKPLTAK